jgi:uncharacterized delta-60 repeat protein
VRRIRATGAVALACAVLLVQTAWAHDSGFGIARYLPDGTLDTAFGSGGVVVTRSAQSSFVADALGLQPDGKILIGGMTTELASGTLEAALARYNSDGTPDSAFAAGGLVATRIGAGGGQVNALVVQPDGMIVVAGTAFSHASTDDEFLLARYTPDGVLDSTFGTSGITTSHIGSGPSAASGLALQPDGRIIVVGTAFSNGATDDDFAIARYTSSGQLDPDFGSGGSATTDFASPSPAARASLDRATAVALQPDNRIVVAGFTRGDHQAIALARYGRDGTLDSTFGRDGRAEVAAEEPQVYSMVLGQSGEIVVAGVSAGPNSSTADFTLIRLLGDGTPDQTFGSGGVVKTDLEGSRSGARAVVAQPDGKLISGGAQFGAPSPQGDALPRSGFALARYQADGTLDARFGVDGMALTSMGDAGAVPQSLAIQPDGKILAAGLVFFQVPSAGATTRLDLTVELFVAGLGLFVLAAGALIVVRRRRLET